MSSLNSTSGASGAVCPSSGRFGDLVDALRLSTLQLTLHEGSAQVAPVTAGIPWLGFVVYPTHRRIKDLVDALRLSTLQPTLHEGSAQVAPVTAGTPWLGFVVYPTHRRIKARKAVQATRRLTERFDAWRAGGISFAEFDASVRGWINHVRYADSWGLREHLLSRFVWGPEAYRGHRGETACG